MSRLRLVTKRKVTQVEDTVPPVLTSATLILLAEGSELSHQITADKQFTAQLTGGADVDQFRQSGDTITFPPETVKDFELPDDANADNDAEFEVILYNMDGYASAPYAHILRTTDVAESAIGTCTHPSDPVAISESEVEVTLAATGATAFDVQVDGQTWRPLVHVGGVGIIANLQPETQVSIKGRGRDVGDVGAESVAKLVTTAAGQAPFSPNAVNLSTMTTMSRGAVLSNCPDGKEGFVNRWFKITGGEGTLRNLFTSSGTNGGRFKLRLRTDNRLELIGLNTAGGITLRLVTTATYLANNLWHQVTISFDLATTTYHFYVDGASAALDGTLTIVINANIDYTWTDYTEGSLVNGGEKFIGEFSESCFHNDYLDISRTVNMRKVRGPDGKARYLGTDGSLVFGVPMVLYLSGVLASWHTNDGTGGGLTLTGTLTQSLNGPNGTFLSGINVPSSDDFIERMVIQTHLNYGDPIWTPTTWRVLMGESHTRYTRSSLGTFSQAHGHLLALNSAYGIKLGRVDKTFIQDNDPETVDGTGDFAAINSSWTFLKNNNLLGMIAWVEGPNEYTKDFALPTYPNWVTTLKAIQQYIYNKVRGDTDPLADDIVVASPSVWRRNIAYLNELGDLSTMADVAVLHLYGGGRRPSMYNRAGGVD